MGEANLFGEAIARDEGKKKTAGAAKPTGPAKLLRAERNQILLMPTDLEALLPEEHVARGMWELVGKLDLTRFLAAIDPRILITLWIYGTSEGVASARELARLCGMHDAYRWICGGVAVCAHTLKNHRRRQRRQPRQRARSSSPSRRRFARRMGLVSRAVGRLFLALIARRSPNQTRHRVDGLVSGERPHR